jgi:hypothetical protein
MNTAELENIRAWDAKCGDNETTFFPVTKDRRRLLEHVDELRELLRSCRQQMSDGNKYAIVERIDAVLEAAPDPNTESRDPASSHSLR